MKTNLAYIDERVSDVVMERQKGTEPSAQDRAAARKAAMKPVAGFLLHDEEAERATLDQLLASRRALIDIFVRSRAAVREKLAAHDIIPLAVLPTPAWKLICDKTKLFRFETDAMISFLPSRSRSAWSNTRTLLRLTGMIMKIASSQPVHCE